MNDKPYILLIDDDEFSALVTVEMLASEYDIRHVESGAAALETIVKAEPCLLLLDVEMPGMSGYEVCRTLRGDHAIGELPIIFLSGRLSDEDRLAGYEAGGDDYLTKPVSVDELRSKIKLALANRTARQRLKTDLSSAFSTAMTAMSSSAEMGAVLQFMRNSFSCPDYESLCREVLNTLCAYGFEASVKIHGRQGSVALSSNGPCSPLEESVLTNMSLQARLFEFGSRTSCSYEHITIIVKSNSRDDPERHGRMKDNLAWLAEGANARVDSIESSAEVVRQHAANKMLLERTHQALQRIDQRHRNQEIRSSRIFLELQKKFDQAMLTIGITQSQEEELASMLETAILQAKALYDEGLEIDEHMECILEQLDKARN
ncbi:MAG: response regulator [Gallionella sp.]|jgi:DNA-binding response OmpR family regulator